MRLRAGCFFIIMACVRSQPPITPAVEDDPQISALVLSPSLITEGESVAVTATFDGGDAVLVVDEVAQPIASDVPVMLTLQRKLGAVYEEREVEVVLTSPQGKVVQTSKRVTLVLPVVSPVLTAPPRIAQTDDPAVARVEPVVGMTYEWTITSGHFTSPDLGTSVSFVSEGDGPVTLSVTALNPLSVRSAPVTASVVVQSIQTLQGLPQAVDAAQLQDGTKVVLSAAGALYSYDATAQMATKLAAKPDCYTITSNPPISRIFASNGMLYGADTCTFNTLALGTDNRPTMLRKDTSWTRFPLCDIRNTSSEHTVSFVDLGDHYLYVVELGGAYSLRRVTANCPDTETANLATLLRQENSPMRLDVAPDGTVYLSSYAKHAIFRLSAGVFTLYAGGGDESLAGADDGPLLQARFKRPGRMVFDAVGRMYVVDQLQPYEAGSGQTSQGAVRVIADGQVSTVATKPGAFAAWNVEVIRLFPSSPQDWIAVESTTVYRRVDR